MLQKNFLFLLLLVFSFNAFALEIDEKLTLRVLKLSDTKKTVLINRGVEDGLAEGDHAKFFITSGVVARGVLVKVSPTRSVWSLYRLINPEAISQDMVMNLKIASAVKVSDDESRMIVEEPKVVAVSRGDSNGKPDIPMAEGADDLEKDLNAGMNKSDKDEMASVMMSDTDLNTRSLLTRNFEVYGMLNLNLLSGTSKPSSGVDPATVDSKYMQLFVGGEYYFTHEDKWYSRFSFFPFISYSSDTVTAATAWSTNITTVEFGGGVNWHPFSKPSESMVFIPYITTGIGRGSIGSKSENMFSSTTSTSAEQTGSLSSFFFGAGAKYYFNNGVGMRLVADYYMRSTTFAGVPATSDVSYEYAQNGFRTTFGLSYRW